MQGIPPSALPSTKASFMRPTFRQFLFVPLALQAIACAQEPPQPQPDSIPALVDFQLPLELGGYFTFDAATPLSRWAKLDIP
ncbi:MAG: hypothetical protein RL173_703 [Fibrobacterota bacterium]